MSQLCLSAAFMAAFLLAATSALAIPTEQEFFTEVDRKFFSPKPLTVEQRLPSGHAVSLTAYRLLHTGPRPIWATLGRPSLVRGHDGRIFQTERLGFSARLLLRNPTDDAALAAAAASRQASRVSVCQIVRMPPARLTCTAAVPLPEGFVIEVSGRPVQELTAGSEQLDATALVAFHSLGGVWTREALESLEQQGEVVCRMSVLRPIDAYQQPAILLSEVFRLRVEDAVQPTPDLLLAAAAPTPMCSSRSRPAQIDLMAAYNFRSNQRVTNLAPAALGRQAGRYQVRGRGQVNFTLDGAHLPGRSWIEIDTEGGALTEHMRPDDNWSVFFMYRTDPGWRHRRASLFSLHANSNPTACSILAWTVGQQQQQRDAIYLRQHNLASGFAVGRVTQPMLSGGWNQIGIASDLRGRQTVYINGARAPMAAAYRFADRQTANKAEQAALRQSLSIGLVRGPAQAMHGTFRCFGVARGVLSNQQFREAFATYCQ